MPRRKLVAGNWKMNTTLAEARALAGAVAAGGVPCASAAVAANAAVRVRMIVFIVPLRR